MASVCRPSGRRIYRIKFLDQHGNPQVAASGMTDRRAAEGMAALIERDVDRLRAGLQPERPDLTGLRWSELSLVERRDFDLDTGVWHCRAELDKTATAQGLPLLPDLLPTLRRLCVGKRPTDRLFPVRQRHRPFDRNLERTGIAKISEDGRRLNFHCLRYTFCSLLAAKLPLKTVQRLMRHANLKRTADLYLQLDLDSLIDQIIELPSLFSLKEKAPEPAERTGTI